ncbi:MAG TPA: YncE family protein, partial [bacterium]|nr:YncE family protein [bacterium]
MVRRFRLTTLVALFVLIPAVAAGAAPFAYIPNSGSSNVTVLDLAAGSAPPATVALPGASLPWGVALNRAGTRLYVTNFGNGAVYVLDTAAHPPVLVATIAVRPMPIAVAVNAAGTRVYVSHQGFNTGAAVTVIDAATHAVLRTVDVGMRNTAIAVHPDGSRVYLATSSSVLVLDAGRLESGAVDIQATVVATRRPYALAMNASGSRLYVSGQASGTVAAIDTATNTLVAEGFVGISPVGLALSPDERRLYVANSGSGTLSVLDAITLQPAAVDVILGGAPSGVDVSADGRIFVTNSAPGANIVWVIDPATFAVSTRTVGVSPVAFGNFVQRPAFVETALQLSVAPSSVVVGSSGPV